MFKRLVLVCALICVAGAQYNREVRHYILNDANLIETAQGFGLNTPALLANNWKAVSVNGGNVQVYTSTCQINTLSLQQVPLEQQQVIARAKQTLYGLDNSANQMTTTTGAARRGTYRISMDGNSMSSSSSGPSNLPMSSFNSNGLSMTRIDAQTMSIGRPLGGLPGNLNRVFITNDLVTFVYQDGRVLMKPAACLTAGEQQLVQQARHEVEDEKRRFDSRMQQFQMNMQNMQQGLQANMQNMQANMQNMFAPGFPFGTQNQGQMMRPNQYGQQQMGQNGMFQTSGFPFNQARQQFGQQQQQQQGYGGYPSRNANGMVSGMQNGAGGAFAQAGGANWPFGQNNSPFYPGFPFGHQQ